MDFTPEEIRRLETRWKSDVDLKLDRLIRFVDKYEGYLESLTLREKKRAEFWERMGEHVAKWGAVSIISGGIYALYLGLKAMARTAL